MKKKQAKLIVIVLLIGAGLIGIATVITAIIYSQIDDVTPEPTPAARQQNTCETTFVEVKDENGEYAEITPNDTVKEGETIMIGARFKSPRGSGNLENTAAVNYVSFSFVINNDSENKVDVSATDKEATIVTQDENFTYYEPSFEWNDWETVDGKDTLTINVVPYGTPLQLDDTEPQEIEVLSNVGSCPVYTYVIERDLPDDVACLELGETGTEIKNDEIQCPLDENGNPTQCEQPDSPIDLITCCTGLVKVDNCSKPDGNNQCTESTTECTSFICLDDISDDICNTESGENYCNSPDDCTPESNDPAEPDDSDPDPNDPEPDPEPVDPEPDPEDPIPDPDDNEGSDPDESPVDTSNFAVSKSGPACVERVTPNNTANFKITVSNSSDAFEDVLQVKDKLPLGFSYVAGSSKINGEEDSSDEFSTVSNTGESQEIVWTRTDGWSIASNEDMIIEFTATAGDNALTGDAVNEVVITPRNNPVNEATLRTEYTFKVAQSCSTPETGILDNTLVKIGIGLTTIVVAGYFYYSQTGVKIAESVHSSTPYNAGANASTSVSDRIKMAYYRVTQPREYFERKVEKKEKKRK